MAGPAEEGQSAASAAGAAGAAGAVTAQLHDLLQQLPLLLSALPPPGLPSKTLSPLHALYPALERAGSADPSLGAVTLLAPLLSHVALTAITDDTDASRAATARLALAYCFRESAPLASFLADIVALLAVPFAGTPIRVHALRAFVAATQEPSDAAPSHDGNSPPCGKAHMLIIGPSTLGATRRLLAHIVLSKVWLQTIPKVRDTAMRALLRVAETRPNADVLSVLATASDEIACGIPVSRTLRGRISSALRAKPMKADESIEDSRTSAPVKKRRRVMNAGCLTGLTAAADFRDADLSPRVCAALVVLCMRALRGDSRTPRCSVHGTTACTCKPLVDEAAAFDAGTAYLSRLCGTDLAEQNDGRPHPTSADGSMNNHDIVYSALDLSAVVLELGVVIYARHVLIVDEEISAANVSSSHLLTNTVSGNGTPTPSAAGPDTARGVSLPPLPTAFCPRLLPAKVADGSTKLKHALSCTLSLFDVVFDASHCELLVPKDVASCSGRSAARAGMILRRMSDILVLTERVTNLTAELDTTVVRDESDAPQHTSAAGAETLKRLLEVSTVCIDLALESDSFLDSVSRVSLLRSSVSSLCRHAGHSESGGEASRIDNVCSRLQHILLDPATKTDDCFTRGLLLSLADCVCYMSLCNLCPDDVTYCGLGRMHKRATERRGGVCPLTVWDACSKIVDSVLRNYGCNAVLGAGTRLLGRLALHAPPGKVGSIGAELVQSLWHPSSNSAQIEAYVSLRRIVIVASYTRPAEVGPDTIGSSSLGLKSGISSAVTQGRSLGHCEDSWDGPNSVARLDSGSGLPCVSALLTTELGARLDRSPCDVQNHRALARLGSLPTLSGDAFSKVFRIARNALINLAVDEVTQARMHLSPSYDPRSSSWHPRSWTELEVCARLANRSRSPSEKAAREPVSVVLSGLIVQRFSQSLDPPGPQPGKSTLRPIFDKRSRTANSTPHSPLLPDIMLRFLSTRYKEWIPLSLPRMLRDDNFTLELVRVLGLRSLQHFWGKVPRFALGALLRDGNATALESLALRVNKPAVDLVDSVCSDALARSVLISPDAFQNEDEKCLRLVQGILGSSIPEILEPRVGKVVQRIVLEFGKGRDSTVSNALSAVARSLGDVRYTRDGVTRCDLLVEDHFLLVMDAINRGLFVSNPSLPERLHCLRVLDVVLRLCQASLYRFVPKVMATLKMCLQIDGNNRQFRSEVCQLWVAFVERIGISRLGPHLGSIISILAPLLRQHHRVLVPALCNVLKDGQESITPYISGVNLLLTTIRHPSLSPIIDLIRKWQAEDPAKSIDVDAVEVVCYDPSNVVLNEDEEKHLRDVEDISTIAAEHDSSAIRCIALERLADVLQQRRGLLVSCLSSMADDLQSKSRRSLLSTVVNRLSSLLLHADSKVRESSWKCLGEVGAIDPVHVRVTSSKVVDRGSANGIAPVPCPDARFVISGELLRECIVPAVLRGDRTGAGSRLNRLCMAIQEVLRTCSCSSATPGQWKEIESAPGPGSGVSHIPVSFRDSSPHMWGALFWGRMLNDSVREVAEPYLSRPFDTSLYGSGTGGSSGGQDASSFSVAALETLEARGPIWIRLSAAAGGDGTKVLPSEWRMQLTAQLTDYVGERGDYGPLLTALRPILRHEDSVSSRVLPLAIMAAFDICFNEIRTMCEGNGTPTRRRSAGTSNMINVFVESSVFKFVLGELMQALDGSGESSLAVFFVVDNLRAWRELRANEKWKSFEREQSRTRGVRRKGPSRAEYLTQARDGDVLSLLVDLEGASKLPLMHIARAAQKSRSYSRAVMYAEQHIQNIRREGGLGSWPAFVKDMIAGVKWRRGIAQDPAGTPSATGGALKTERGGVGQQGEVANVDDVGSDFSEDLRIGNSSHSSRAGRQVALARDVRAETEALMLIQNCMSELEDADAMIGIALLRQDSSLQERILDAEALGTFDDALLCYERALAESPEDSSLHAGFLRCLRTLGHWETMLAHAEGLLLKRHLSNKPNVAAMGSMARALGMEAAWRLGRWDRVEGLCDDLVEDGEYSTSLLDSGKFTADPQDGTEWEAIYGTAVGEMLACVRRRDPVDICRIADRARACLLAPAADAAMEGYSRAYPFVVKLHCLADIEDTIRFVSISKDASSKSFSDKQKMSLVAPDSSALDVNVQSGTAGHEHTAQDVFASLALIGSDERSDSTSSALHLREPILSCRRVCLELLGRTSEAAVVSLQLAKLARLSGNLRAASAAAYRAMSMASCESDEWYAASAETAQIQAAQGNKTGALQSLEKDIDRMSSTLRLETSRSLGTIAASSVAWRQRLASAHVLAAKWIEEAQSAPSDEIVSHLRRATELAPLDGEPFYALGRFYDTLLQSCGNENGRQDGLTRAKCVPVVLLNFAEALRLGHRWLFEILPRMLTVWFDFYSTWHAARSGIPIEIEQKVQRITRRALQSLPQYMWMTVLPQLMSRLLHPSPTVCAELHDLLASIVVAFPDQAVWTIAPSSQLKSAARKEATGHILNKSVALARKRRSDPQDGKAAVNALKKRIRTGLVIIKHLITVCATQVSKDKRGRMEDCSEEFHKLRQDARGCNVLMPTLAALTVTLPNSSSSSRKGIGGRGSGASGASGGSGSGNGARAHGSGSGKFHEAFAAQPVTIADVHPEALVMSSLMRPRRIELVGSDGKRYRFLAKRETAGDMRKDSRLMDFLTVVNRLLAKEREAQRRDLHIKTYAVLPLTEETGLIEWVDNIAPLRTLVREEQQRFGALADVATVQAKYGSMDKRRFHEEWGLPRHAAALDRYFVRQFGGDPAAWLAARNTWTRSVAVWSMTGYVVGLGDRHGENVLVETTSGLCVHVDFAMLFDKGRQLKVPEIVPFRLTHNMVAAMGVAGYEGVFRVVCEIVMGVLRGNADALMGVLESFLHDPLADWAKGGGGGGGGAGSAIGAARGSGGGGGGGAHDGPGDEGVNVYAAEMRRAVHAKLRGMFGDSPLPLSIKGQVQRLIHEATSTANLSQMYLWWGAWST